MLSVFYKKLKLMYKPEFEILLKLEGKVFDSGRETK